MSNQSMKNQSENGIMTSETSLKKATKILVILLIIALAALVLYTINMYNDLDIVDGNLKWVGGSDNTSDKIDSILRLGDFLSYGSIYVLSYGTSFFNTLLELIWIGLPIYAIYKFFQMKNCQIEVSNTMITGRESFGKNVHIPINTVASVNKGKFNSVIITSGGKKTVFWLLDGGSEIADYIAELISQNTTQSVPQIGKSDADELSKYKELLEKGVISQEEFDAKKKQLLGI